MYSVLSSPILGPYGWFVWFVWPCEGITTVSTIACVDDGIRGIPLLAHEPWNTNIGGHGHIGSPLDVTVSLLFVCKLDMIVLVLNLSQDDGTSLGSKELLILHHLYNLRHEGFHVKLVGLIVRAEYDARDLSKPIRKTSVVPLGLDEGTNPESDKHAFGLNEPNELDKIIIALEVELAGLWLVSVPENVSLNDVQASAPCFVKNVRPHIWGASCVMDGAGKKDLAPSVNEQ